MKPDIKVHGADELARDLAKIGRSLDAQIREEDRAQATRLAPQIRSAAYSQGSTAAHVAPSVRAAGSSVSLGGPGWPMAGGAEFGSNIYPQFKSHGTGYFFAPTMKKAEAKAPAEYGKALDQILRKADLT